MASYNLLILLFYINKSNVISILVLARLQRKMINYVYDKVVFLIIQPFICSIDGYKDYKYICTPNNQCLTFSDKQNKSFMTMLNYILRCVQYGSPFEQDKF